MKVIQEVLNLTQKEEPQLNIFGVGNISRSIKSEKSELVFLVL